MDKIVELFAKNRLLVNVIILITIAVGMFSYTAIKKEAFPSTNFDVMIVQVIYPGASPEDVEQNAMIPIEDELQTIAGIDEFYSIMIENAGILTIRIDMKIKDTRPIKDEIFRRLQNAPNVSKDVTEIKITEANANRLPIYNIGIKFKEGMEGTEKELYDISKRFEKELKYVDGVATVEVYGRTDPEIQIIADPYKLQEYYTSLSEIVQALSLRNVRLTSGSMKPDESEGLDAKNKLLVTTGQFQDPISITNVIVRSIFNGKPIRIADVARVEEMFVDKTVYMRVNKENGYSINIVKKEDADILKTIENVNAYFEKNKSTIPSNIEIVPMFDNSRTINDLLNAVSSNIITGFIIIFIILIIFLDFKSAIFTSLGMLIVISVSLIFMTYSGITFNIISLGGLITVLGMIVDNSIVVSENIFNFHQRGFKGLDATKNAVHEVFMPMLISTLTTVASFVPILFVGGTMGRLLNQYPKVVIIALIASIFQAVLILPNNLITNEELTGIKKKKRFNFKNPLDFDKDKLFDKLKIPFVKFLKLTLKHRYLVLIFFISIFIVSIFIFKIVFSQFILVYDTSADVVVINMDAGVGAPLYKTEKYLSEIEDIIYKTVDTNDMIAVYSLLGKQLDKNTVDISEEMDNLAGTIIYLVPANNRKKVAYDIADDLEKAVEEAGLRDELALLTIHTKLPITPGKAVDVKIIGNDTEKVKEVKDKIKAHLLTLEGVVNYDDDDKIGMEELRVLFDYDRMSELGVNVAYAARELRAAYSGIVATSIQQFENKLDFRVRMDKKYTYDTNVLNNLYMPSTYGRLIQLKDIATIEVTNNQSSIRHYNGKKSITLTTDIVLGKTTAIRVTDSVQKFFDSISKDYPNITIEFGGEVKETKEPMKSIAYGYVVAIIAIYLILLLQFNKFIQPLMILGIIPFGVVGVILGFAAHRMPMSFVGAVGIVGLAGVVVNNGIIMVDLINRILEEGNIQSKQDVFNAVVEGAGDRFRAIFLTTVTTIFGLLPTVYGIGGNADLIVPMVMAMAYGLLFASLLTLIFLPSLFMISVDLKLVKVKYK
ncbi:efflux RND transporter permease subunit [Brachyspira pilosicoli]|uniref:efflux RND transporter permease subunit n=1 Tax=Brachyspira pilosicoli TaxID=52584 RepID=UPI0025426F81|nr:efflux RND transporter permease subunit [Brachyspira pilosicoli]WIH85306.1 efflux RND transporter permease subunit [Brachyspira pilosicoli]